jgi:asparaginyl-tRNA synthetase
MRSQAISNITKFFEKEDFVNVHPPLITSSDCEGAGEVFTVNSPAQITEPGAEEHFFRQPKYLTVSSQLHLEALAASVGDVWTLSPTFRAEKSDTPRHLSEFYMLEAEQMFTESLESVMDVVERLLQSVTKGLIRSQVGEELLQAAGSKMHDPSDAAITKEDLQKRWSKLESGNWPRISYTDAISHLQEAAKQNRELFQFTPAWGQGLQAEHEKYIAKTIGQDGPVFVTDYPRPIKAFYMPATPGQASDTPDANLTVSCFDLVVPELCEIVGGSLREHELDPLLASMTYHGMIKDESLEQAHIESEENNKGGHESDASGPVVPHSLQWYVDLRRYGSVPHGGFGLGFDRLLCYLSGVSSIRDMVAFPRWHGRCDC